MWFFQKKGITSNYNQPLNGNDTQMKFDHRKMTERIKHLTSIYRQYLAQLIVYSVWFRDFSAVTGHYSRAYFSTFCTRPRRSVWACFCRPGAEAGTGRTRPDSGGSWPMCWGTSCGECWPWSDSGSPAAKLTKNCPHLQKSQNRISTTKNKSYCVRIRKCL